MTKVKSLTYHGWLVGNDSYPKSVKEHYRSFINKSVYGLNHLLKFICDNEPTWKNLQQEYRLPIKNHKQKAFDFYLEINNLKVLVEFNRNQHYSNIGQIVRDTYWQNLAIDCNYQIVRIPYFIKVGP